ncbi:synaptic glyco protein SC2 [Protomyces lactucae-debilis]|uniref:Synaptic glyco protein SC2 n=1 Tax=Protomyces lactucae-debilis TaxID=2754530 RepID=A0A1Y2F1K6_PROLT|nr:synaptic glyco protein SC2 [Protomyces lactucae-debilis]ORY77740.1 synaptic glyco protein SC2 [Protomyces lactucae-debilis]
MITVSLSAKGKKVGKLPASLSSYKGVPASELVQIIAKKTGLNPNRLRLKQDDKTLDNKQIISDDVHLVVKDLGPQISWRTVFVCEYAGPLLIHPLIFFGLYDKHSSAQYITLAMVMLHFLKREYETMFVHRFSAETMPFFNLFKNCAHYWIIGGALLAWFTYGPAYAVETWQFPKIAVFTFVMGEMCNLKTHKILRDLRRPGSTERRIPYGLGFDWVSCPNYFFEILCWVGISATTGSHAAWAFTIVSAAQMWQWSLKKHQRYLKEFPKDYPKDRKILIPFVL